MDTERCQSCGMPLGSGFYGTQADGEETHTYCKNCYSRGSFREPDLTVDAMVDRSIEHMTRELGFTKDKAEHLARSVIPKLARWN